MNRYTLRVIHIKKLCNISFMMAFFNPLSFHFNDGWCLRWHLRSDIYPERPDWKCHYGLVETGRLDMEMTPLDEQHLEAKLVLNGATIKEMIFVQPIGSYYSPTIRSVLTRQDHDDIKVRDMIRHITEFWEYRKPEIDGDTVFDVRITPKRPFRYEEGLSDVEDDSCFYAYIY